MGRRRRRWLIRTGGLLRVRRHWAPGNAGPLVRCRLGSGWVRDGRRRRTGWALRRGWRRRLRGSALARRGVGAVGVAIAAGGPGRTVGAITVRPIRRIASGRCLALGRFAAGGRLAIGSPLAGSGRGWALVGSIRPLSGRRRALGALLTLGTLLSFLRRRPLGTGRTFSGLRSLTAGGRLTRLRPLRPLGSIRPLPCRRSAALHATPLGRTSAARRTRTAGSAAATAWSLTVVLALCKLDPPTVAERPRQRQVGQDERRQHRAGQEQ
ncbi:hypothetical protein GCM10025880_25880 [Methylorubrum aminovorans]|nr:hypothetical protein GCM10025880_25880 [Methylorubrum aminovorans]